VTPARPPGSVRHPGSGSVTRAPARWLLQLVLVGLGSSIVPLDTAVNIGFPDITRSFGLALPLIQWVVICYVLTYASLMLAFGRVGDIFGHARVFRTGLAWSVAAFLLCAAAPSYGALLFCRFLQGIGAGLVISVAPALVTGLFPEHRRSHGVAAFTLIFALASAAGPLVGGALVARWGWPSVFWFRAPIALLALAFWRGLPRAPGGAAREPLDIAGAVLLAVAISGLLLAIDKMPDLGHGGWPAPALIMLAILAVWGFVRRERRIPAPIIDLGLFQSRPFAAINIASVVVYLTSFSVLLLGPYYLVRSALMPLPAAGAMLALSFVGASAVSPLAGRLIGRIAADRLAAAGAVLGGAGLIAIAGWTLGYGATPAIIGALLIQGCGLGLFQVGYMDVVIAAMPVPQRGVAGSVAMLTRTLGVVAGATLLTLVFHSIERAAAGSGDAAAAFAAAFRGTFLMAGSVSILTGLLMPRFARRGAG
jgi:MFS family permease